MAKWDEAYELIASTAKALAAYSNDAREMVLGAIEEEASRIAEKAEQAEEPKKGPKKSAAAKTRQRRQRSDAGKPRGPRKSREEVSHDITDEEAQDSHAQREIPL